MKYTIKEGNYSKMGVVSHENEVIFTFKGEKEDKCNLVLINKSNKKETKIEVPNNFCLGSLRSVSVMNIDMDKFVYYYEINGEKKIDPYSTKIVGREKWNNTNREANSYEIFSAIANSSFDWGDDTGPEISKRDMILYKAHVRGFTKGQKGLHKKAGTFCAMTDKIPYLKELGFTSLEVMPVYEFEEMEITKKMILPKYINWNVEIDDSILPEKTEETTSKINYWGYGPGNYFSVKSSYAFDSKKPEVEFKTLIKTLHENDMECIMEIFFEDGTNHNLIIDVLRYWVCEYHVDGFHLLGNNIPITAIVQDIMLSRTKILYDKFDEQSANCRGKYNTLFISKDEYLYPSRKLLNHMNGTMREFLNQQRKQGTNIGYINYISSNNGFTLADLFMYNDKHNESNGEENLDGNEWNFSNNYGVEGPTRKSFVKAIRKLKWRNSMMMLFLAQGVPMLWEGDEIGNSQEGNNNAYCQDNSIGWVNWKQDKIAKEKLDFLKKLIDFRKNHTILSNEVPFRFNDYGAFGYPDFSYHGDAAWISDSDLDRMCVGIMYCGEYAPESASDDYVYIGYNFFSRKSSLALPKLCKDRKWFLVADSSRQSQQFLDEMIELENQTEIELEPQEICILVGKK